MQGLYSLKPMFIVSKLIPPMANCTYMRHAVSPLESNTRTYTHIVAQKFGVCSRITVIMPTILVVLVLFYARKNVRLDVNGDSEHRPYHPRLLPQEERLQRLGVFTLERSRTRADLIETFICRETQLAFISLCAVRYSQDGDRGKEKGGSFSWPSDVCWVGKPIDTKCLPLDFLLFGVMRAAANPLLNRPTIQPVVSNSAKMSTLTAHCGQEDQPTRKRINIQPRLIY